MAVPFPAIFGISNVQQVSVFKVFQAVGFIRIKPHSLTVGATINRNPFVGDLLHTMLAFRTL
jgi:hypothetical protein